MVLGTQKSNIQTDGSTIGNLTAAIPSRVRNGVQIKGVAAW
jgi:hypothetical protein